MTTRYRLFVLGGAPEDLAATAWGPFDARACGNLDELTRQLRAEPAAGVCVQLADPDDVDAFLHWPALTATTLESAVVVALPEPTLALALRLLDRGVQDVLPSLEATPAALARALRLGLERKRRDRQARQAYATDVATGLPGHAQLIEHMNHLLALREREPTAMSVLAVRIEGLTTIESQLGAESANVLRRKIAVRLRVSLRASDVVATIGADAFAVLLASMDTAADGARVAGKLVRSLTQPFNVGGSNVVVAVSIGVSLYPDHGRDAEGLLRRALGESAGQAAIGRTGFANFGERGPATAANDD